MTKITAIWQDNQTLFPCRVRKNFYTGYWQQWDSFHKEWVLMLSVHKNAHVVFHDGAWRVVV